MIVDRYEKVRRVPFGEYVPLRSLLETLGAPVDQIGRDAVAGTGPAVIELPDGTELGVVISWEVFFGGRAREGVELGAEAILNPTNGSSYTGTIVQTQQVASSRLRAVENGRWVVQAAPTGFTAVIDAGGDVLERTSISERRVVYTDIELRSGLTWYTEPRRRPDHRRADRRAAGVDVVRRSLRPHPSPSDRLTSSSLHLEHAYTSSRMVTGPSLTSSTCMSVRKRPVSTVSPR